MILWNGHPFVVDDDLLRRRVVIASWIHHPALEMSTLAGLITLPAGQHLGACVTLLDAEDHDTRRAEKRAELEGLLLDRARKEA